MAVLEVLVGGGLALAGSVGGQLYAARRERQRDEAAAASARVERQRTCLIELQQAVADANVRAAVARSRRSAQDSGAFMTAHSRMRAAAARLLDADLRQQLDEFADQLLPWTCEKPSDEVPMPKIGRVTRALGEHLRALDE